MIRRVPTENRFASNQICLWWLQLNQFNISILAFSGFYSKGTACMPEHPSCHPVGLSEILVTHEQCIFSKLFLSCSENILKNVYA